MAYTPINWQTGDTITAEKLNRCDNGWSAESSSTTICEESVTTATGDMGIPEAVLSYSSEITADTLIITLNGTDYNCPKIDFNETYFYGGFDADDGAPDFSTYPFFFWADSKTLYTETEGSYSVAIGVPSTAIEASDNFKEAVLATSTLHITDTSGTLDKTFAEIRDAFLAGKNCLILRNNKYYLVYTVDVANLQINISASYYDSSSEDAYPVYH